MPIKIEKLGTQNQSPERHDNMEGRVYVGHDEEDAVAIFHLMALNVEDGCLYDVDDDVAVDVKTMICF